MHRAWRSNWGSGGATFRALKVPFNNILSIALDPVSSTLYAGTGSGPTFGIYNSTDDGQTWSRLGALSLVNALAIAPNSTSTSFAATDSGLMKSTDGGANWAQSGSFYQVSAVIFDPQDAQTVYASALYDGIF